MTDNKHPITPPSELMQQWWDSTHGALYEFEAVVTQAARWGADQELDACCEWLEKNTRDHIAIEFLRAARRPKPPSLKEHALEQLKSLEVAFLASHGGNAKTESIRRALESLPD